MTESGWTSCPGCGARVPDIEGPTHKYIGAAPGCWGIYGEVLAREYENAAYFGVHQLTVDTYSAQHPGEPSPQTIQSVAVHLISLYHMIESGGGHAEAIAAKQRGASVLKGRFHWLEPPESQGAITVLDVHAAESASAHHEIVHRWAESVWRAWSAHHATIREWAVL